MCIPLILLWNGSEGWIDALEVVGLVTLITDDLPLRGVLPPTYAARTVLAFPPGVVQAVGTFRLVCAW